MNSNYKKKIVITGASGFLGRNLIEELKGKNEYIVFAFTSRSRELKINNGYSNIWYYDKDYIFLDKSILEDSVVINCAFPRNSSGIGMAEGLSYINKVFIYAKKYKAKAIINISSQSVYSSIRKIPATEAASVCLENQYAVGKYATELMLDALCRDSEIKYTNLRMASLIGPDFEQRIVNRFVRSALKEQFILVKISKQMLGFMDIQDAVSGIMKMIQSNNLMWQSVYNLGVQHGYTIKDIANYVCLITKERYQINVKTEYEYSDDYVNSTIDASNFSKDFIWNPVVSIESSIQKIMDYEVKKDES